MEDQLGALGLVLNCITLWEHRLPRRPGDAVLTNAAGVTTGSGACAVTGLVWEIYDLTSADRLLVWLVSP